MTQRRFPHLTVVVGVVTAGLVLAVVACGDGGGVSAPSREAVSGESLFRDLTFREGVFAELFAEVGSRVPLRNYTPEQLEARERARVQFMAKIRQADPTFFGRFGADIQSGNHLRIEKALRESARLVKQVSPERKLSSLDSSGDGSTVVTVSGNDNTVYANTEAGNTVINNTAYGNTAYGNMSAGNSEIDNTATANTERENTSVANTEWGNTSVANTDDVNIVVANTNLGNEAIGNTEWGDTEVDDANSGGDESAWSGARLAREQLIELIATRLSAE